MSRPEPTRVRDQPPRRSRLTIAIALAAGFLAGVLVVAALGGAKGVDRTTTRRVTVTTPRASVPQGGGADDGGGTIVASSRVPALVGSRLDEAKERLDDAQFDVEVRGGGVFGVLDDSNWEVVGQDPGPGSLLDPGSTVEVDIVRR